MSEQQSGKSAEEKQQEKKDRRKKRRRAFMEALRYHHRPNAIALASTTVSGGYQKPQKEGLNEDLQSKVGDKLQGMRRGLHTSRAMGQKRGKQVFRQKKK